MEKRTQSYVNEAVRLILEKPFVKDVIVLNKNGNPVQSTMGAYETLEVTGLLEALRVKVQTALEILDSNNELVMLRVRSRKNEILLTPDGNVTVIVIQDPKDCFVK